MPEALTTLCALIALMCVSSASVVGLYGEAGGINTRPWIQIDINKFNSAWTYIQNAGNNSANNEALHQMACVSFMLK